MISQSSSLSRRGHFSYQLSVISYQLLAISYQLSVPPTKAGGKKILN
ncbi:MAG: hypothetical protein F6K17_04800 [Okeania sp. SIO3C4]|nr:hypothetical protein [Okeania sp. SIO3C4]